MDNYYLDKHDSNSEFLKKSLKIQKCSYLDHQMIRDKEYSIQIKNAMSKISEIERVSATFLNFSINKEKSQLIKSLLVNKNDIDYIMASVDFLTPFSILCYFFNEIFNETSEGEISSIIRYLQGICLLKMIIIRVFFRNHEELDALYYNDFLFY